MSASESLEPAHFVGDENSLEADENVVGNEDDSAIGSDIESVGSTSLTSSIYGYEYENGRRYHREGQYFLPNDDMEQARLDLVHHVYRLLIDGGLYLAPIDRNIKRCLEFGTGTGIWAIDFADEFPNCEVIGTDLSPIQPTTVPPNLSFYVDDVEADWAFDANFDFIHGRGMGGAILDWPRLMGQAYDNLNPGGWLEMKEYAAWLYSNSDPSLAKCPNVQKWLDDVNLASSQFGKPIDMAHKQKDLMEAAGFVDVVQVPFSLPVGTWAKGKKHKEIGVYNQEVVLEGVDAFTIPLFTRILGWKTEDCERLMAHLRRELKDPSNQFVNQWIESFPVFETTTDFYPSILGCTVAGTFAMDADRIEKIAVFMKQCLRHDTVLEVP